MQFDWPMAFWPITGESEFGQMNFPGKTSAVSFNYSNYLGSCKKKKKKKKPQQQQQQQKLMTHS